MVYRQGVRLLVEVFEPESGIFRHVKVEAVCGKRVKNGQDLARVYVDDIIKGLETRIYKISHGMENPDLCVIS